MKDYQCYNMIMDHRNFCLTFKARIILPLILVPIIVSKAHAFYTEVGINYSYKKSVLDSLNMIEQQTTTGSLSFYIWERVAVEFSYTNGLNVKKEKELASTTSNSQRITTQYTNIYESNLIYVFADRKTVFQPYIKGGGAYIQKRQVAQIDNTDPWEITQTGWAPGAGVGFKYLLTDSIGLKVSYDVLKTPVDNSTSIDDVMGRIGLSWIF